jgi:ATP-dependent Lon protease
VLSGGKATPASLFINLNTGKVGLVGTREAVVFDEIANTDFTDPKATVSIMQGYMQDAKFSRGKKEILAFGSIVLVGNLDVQGKLPHEKYYHLFEPLPSFIQVEALIDRLHYYLPGWEIPKIGPESASQDYGFITDYLCEIMHELRRVDGITKARVKNRFELFDAAGSSQGITSRDVRGVHKTLSGLLKLLYPHGEVSDEQLEELLLLALEGRQRIRNQLHLMAPGEYYPVQLSARMIPSGKAVAPTLLEAGRKQRIELPTQPLVGEVIHPALRDAGHQGAWADRPPGLYPAGDARVHRGRSPVHPRSLQRVGHRRRLARELRRGCAGDHDGGSQGRPLGGHHYRHGHRVGAQERACAPRRRHDRRDHHHGQGARRGRHPG